MSITCLMSVAIDFHSVAWAKRDSVNRVPEAGFTPVRKETGKMKQNALQKLRVSSSLH